MDNPANAEGEERRVAPRRRVLKPARIVCNNGQRTIDCVIRNISETGAQIDTESTVDLPGSFWLDCQDGRTRPVELVWQKSNLLGVRFADSQPRANGAPGHGTPSRSALIARIDDIERQLAELRAAITAGLYD
jgi:hypothetical protein